MKFSLKKYLLYSSIFAIFTEAFFFHFIIDWKLLYAIVIINFYLLGRITKIRLNKYFGIILLGIFLHALIGNTLAGVPYNYMLSQIMGIAILGIYYYNFIANYQLDEITRVYVKMCLYVAIIGYIFYFLKINVQHDHRLQSIFKEPAHYVVVVIPACFYYFKAKKYLAFAVIFGTLILSNSSLGYMGCALMLIVPNISRKRVLYLLAFFPLIIAAFIYTYNEHEFFKMRVKETYESLNVINTGKFDDYTNLSSYAWISNLNVAKRNIEDHPFGTGIGSHYYMHTENYISQLRPPGFIRELKLQETNATDANSLFTRIISEGGIPGIILLIYLMYFAASCFRYKELFLPQGIFIYFLLKLFRDGHYFPPELYFFVWMLYYYVNEYRSRKKQLKTD